MKVLVTGAAGFNGSHLTGLLLQQGHEVVALDDLSTGNLRNLAAYQQAPGLRFVQADIRDRAALMPYFAGVDWVMSFWISSSV